MALAFVSREDLATEVGVGVSREGSRWLAGYIGANWSVEVGYAVIEAAPSAVRGAGLAGDGDDAEGERGSG